MKTISIVLLAIGFLVAAEGCKRRSKSTDAGGDGNSGNPSATPKNGRGTFTVGKATTYMTGPLDADGRVDYALALNERLSKGVTPENNANVLFWKALGPNPAGSTQVPPGLFDKLGISTPPANGDYFIGLRQYVERNPNLGSADAAYDTLTKLAQRPWTAEQQPGIHAWLMANEKSLALVVEGTKRTHYYSPLLPQQNEKGSTGLWSSLLPGVQGVREPAQALSARALLHASHGQPYAAWEDLLACHRLGRLIGRGGLLIEGLVGVSIELIACRADIAFIEKTQPDATKLAGYIRDLCALPPMPAAADQIDLSERLAYLDTVMAVDRQGLSAFTSIRSGDNISRPPPDGMLTGIDWNPGLESANRWYDLIVDALRQKNRGLRNQKLNELEAELGLLQSSFLGGAGQTALHEPSLPASTRGKVVGEFFLTALFPAGRKIQDAHDRSLQTLSNVITAFALAAYHRDNGRYPDRLDVLAPKYLKEVPRDLFSGNALIYRPALKGYLLYSVGPNGKDDGGHGPEDKPEGDDIVVRMPVPR